MSDDDLVIRASLEGEHQVSAGLEALRRVIRRTKDDVEKLEPAGRKGAGGIDRVPAAAKRANNSLRDLHRNLMSTSNALSTHLYTATRRTALGLGALSAAVGAFGIKSAATIQTSRIAIDTLVGSAEKGEEVFRRIQAMNLKSPFEYTDLARAGQDLLNSSLSADQALRVLQSLGDIAALSADPTNNLIALARATRQVADANRLLGQDANQFAQAGVNIYKEIAAVTGKSISEVRKLGEEGQISSDIVIDVLANLGGGLQRFANGSEKANRSLMGQWSNLKDSLAIRLADLADPVVDELTTGMPKIIEMVGSFVDEIGPPIFGLIGDLADGASMLLPIVGPPIRALTTGLGQLLTVAGPSIRALEPLGGELGDGLANTFVKLEPVMPDVVESLGLLVGMLPELADAFVTVAKPTIIMTSWVIRLVDVIPGADRAAGFLLVTLVGYSRVSSLVGGLRAFAGALGFIGTEAEIAGTKAVTARTRLLALSAIAAGGMGVAAGASGAYGGQSALSDAGFVGSAALLGAGIGSVVPGLGTGVGAVGGGAIGLGVVLGRRVSELLGDPVVPGGTMGRHLAAGGGAPGLQITSGLRAHSLRSSASGHLNGSAVDVVGPGLASYVQRVRQQGGWATIESKGGRQHAHADFGDAPASARTVGRGTTSGATVVVQGPLAVFSGPVRSDIDVERAFDRALTKAERRRRERAFDDVRGR